MNLVRITPSIVLNPLLARHKLEYQNVGRCVGTYPVIHGNGRMATRNAPVREGEGFADTEGAPFKAYYCAKCAAERGAA